MDNLHLRYWPDECLHMVCLENDLPKEERKAIGKQMLKIMFDNNGYGLAASQVGLDIRLFVMRDPEDHNKGLIFSNPEVIEVGTKMDVRPEGCLSLLSQKVMISRPWDVEFEFDNPEEDGGEKLRWRFEGINARCVLHEIDHLNGKMIFDHLQGLAQKLFLERYAKKRRQYAKVK